MTTAAGRKLRLVLKRPYIGPEDPDPVEREARCLAIAARSDIPVPEVVGADPNGRDAGDPALLLTRLPGRHRLRARDWRSFMRSLLELLPRIHAVDVTPDGLDDYRPFDPHRRLPAPAGFAAGEWERLLEVFTGPEPAGGPRVFLHRDFHQANVLWSRRRITGVVDWMQGCVGSPWADLAHFRWNLFDLVSAEAADFAVAEFHKLVPSLPAYHPYWDIATGVSIGPGRRRDAFLKQALARL